MSSGFTGNSVLSSVATSASFTVGEAVLSKIIILGLQLAGLGNFRSVYKEGSPPIPPPRARNASKFIYIPFCPSLFKNRAIYIYADCTLFAFSFDAVGFSVFHQPVPWVSAGIDRQPSGSVTSVGSKWYSADLAVVVSTVPPLVAVGLSRTLVSSVRTTICTILFCAFLGPKKIGRDSSPTKLFIHDRQSDRQVGN